MPSKNADWLKSLTEYCEAHPEERGWQALKNWSEADEILYVKGGFSADTYEWGERVGLFHGVARTKVWVAEGGQGGKGGSVIINGQVISVGEPGKPGEDVSEMFTQFMGATQYKPQPNPFRGRLVFFAGAFTGCLLGTIISAILIKL